MEELQQVEQLGLSLVCPPPSPQQLSEHGIGAEFEPVLAWDLGEQLSSDDLDSVERWERLVARYDPIDARPTLLSPQLHTLEASRITDYLLVGRAAVGTELTLREHTVWLAQRQRLARPGTPIWTLIETQCSPSHQLQTAALSIGSGVDNDATYSQLIALTTAALGVKTQLLFSIALPVVPDQTGASAETAAAQGLAKPSPRVGP